MVLLLQCCSPSTAWFPRNVDSVKSANICMTEKIPKGIPKLLSKVLTVQPPSWLSSQSPHTYLEAQLFLWTCRPFPFKPRKSQCRKHTLVILLQLISKSNSGRIKTTVSLLINICHPLLVTLNICRAGNLLQDCPWGHRSEVALRAGRSAGRKYTDEDVYRGL